LKKFMEIEIWRAREPLVGQSYSTNMVNGKGNDLTAPMIVAEHLECRAIRVKIDSIGIELTLGRMVLCQRAVAHQHTLLFQSSRCKKFNCCRMRRKVFDWS